MLKALLSKLLGSLLRNALTGGGTGLAVDGLLTGDQVQAAIGAVTTLVGVGSSLIKAVKEAKAHAKVVDANSVKYN